jgi:hypothetical protein
MKPTARIVNTKDKGLWLFVNKPDNTDDLSEHFKKALDVDDSIGSVAYAILPEEVEAIRDACQEWLEGKRKGGKTK